jgi:tripartite motif-containing protein 71
MQKLLVRKSIKVIATVVVTVLFWGSTLVASENYELASDWGGFGSGDGQLDSPSGIDIDGEDNIYVADQENCRIQKFTSEGDFITSWGSCESGTEDFFKPIDVTTDKNGNVYVISSYAIMDDQDNILRVRNIQKFTAVGDFLIKWGSYGSEDGEFLIPTAIVTDSEGNIFVADRNYVSETKVVTSRIQKFSPEGEFIWKLYSSGTFTNGELDFYALGLAVDGEDTLYVVSSMPILVHKFNTDGELLSEWNYFDSTVDILPVPNTITADREGNVYVTMEPTSQIKKFTSNGEFLTQWAPTPSGEEFNLKPQPWDTAVDSKGNVYVTILNTHVVQKYAKNGQVEQPCPIEVLYGEHAEKTELLRHFRDTVLSQSTEGQELIKLYYEWSPVIVKAMEKDEKFKESVKGMIEGFLSLITGGA